LFGSTPVAVLAALGQVILREPLQKTLDRKQDFALSEEPASSNSLLPVTLN
jgi:hypothetical protein